MNTTGYKVSMETTSGMAYTGNGGVMGWSDCRNELTYNGVVIARISEIVNVEMLQQMLENLNYAGTSEPITGTPATSLHSEVSVPN